MLFFKNFDKYIVKSHFITKLSVYNSLYFNTLQSVFFFFKSISLLFVRIKYSILPRMNTFLSYYQTKLYFYSILKSNVLFLNQSSLYDNYNMYIKHSDIYYGSLLFS